MGPWNKANEQPFVCMHMQRVRKGTEGSYDVPSGTRGVTGSVTGSLVVVLDTSV